jgi:hypothetical protein
MASKIDNQQYAAFTAIKQAAMSAYSIFITQQSGLRLAFVNTSAAAQRRRLNR